MQIKQLFIIATFILIQRNILSSEINKNYREIYSHVRAGNIEKVGELLDKGIDVNISAGRSIPPLVIVTTYATDGDQEMLYFLLKRGANVHAKTYYDKTVLERSVIWGLNKHINLINAWITYLKTCKEHYILKNSLLISSSVKELIPDLSKIISEYRFPFDDETFPKYIYQHPNEFPEFEYKLN